MPSIVAHSATTVVGIQSTNRNHGSQPLQVTSISDSNPSIAFCNLFFVPPFSIVFNLEWNMPHSPNYWCSQFIKINCPLATFAKGENSAVDIIFWKRSSCCKVLTSSFKAFYCLFRDGQRIAVSQFRGILLPYSIQQSCLQILQNYLNYFTSVFYFKFHAKWYFFSIFFQYSFFNC